MAKATAISTNAIVKFNGNVTWLSTVIYKSSCSINVRYFPFDEQTCEMIFASWTFDGFFLDLNVNSKEGDQTNYIQNGEWHLVRLGVNKVIRKYSCCEQPYPEIYYKLVIRRRPLYYVFNMVLPCLLITVVAFLGFFLPPGSSDKVSIGITTLLSLTVFLMLVVESMPANEQLPLIGIYYFVTIGIVSFSTAMAVLTLNINNKGANGRKVPRIIKIIFFNYLAKLLKTELSTTKRRVLYQNINSEQQIQTELNDSKYKKCKYHVRIKKINNQDKIKLNGDKDEMGNIGINEYPIVKKHLNESAKLSEKLILEATDEFYFCNKIKKKLNNSDENLLSFVNCDELSNNVKINKQSNINQLLIKPCPLSKEDTNRQKQKQNNYQTSPTKFCRAHCSCDCNDQYVNRNSVQNFQLYSCNYHDYKKKGFRKNNDDEQSLKDSEEIYSNVNDANFMNKDRRDSQYANVCCNYSKLISQKYEFQGFNKNFLGELEKLLERQFNPLIKCLLGSIEINEKRLVEKQNLEIITNEWSDVARICDHFLCFFFPIMTIGVCLLIFLNSPYVFSTW